MKNTDTINSTEESLSIIRQMIHQTRGNMKSDGFHLILWGWVALLGNLGHYALWTFTDYPHPYIVWLIAFPAWGVSFWHGHRQEEKTKVVNYSDRLIMWTWIAFGISLILIIFSGKFGPAIPSLTLILAGMATFVTGCITRYKPVIYGGSMFWIFAAIALAVSPANSLLVSAVAILVGYLIPGYMLKNLKE